MSDNLSYIEDYFNKSLSPEETRLFEERITAEPAFAEEVSFYISTRNLAKQQSVAEKKARFRALYDASEPAKVVEMPGSKTRTWRLVAIAASIISIVVLGVVFFKSDRHPNELADEYIKENLEEISPSMSVQDSLEAGKQLYNKKDYAGALIIFESILNRDHRQSRAREYAGIVSLQMNNYDKALSHFSELEETRLESNPGKFYHALTLMKRDQPGDNELAKKLLQEVVDQHLWNEDVAAAWLKKW